MSEYQYYEFQALDRPLTREEMAAVAQISSRATVTAHSATFIYNYKDFPGDAGKVLVQYFDVLLSLSAWGQRRLMFRFPISAVDRAALRPYSTEDLIDIEQHGAFLTLDLQPWIEEPTGEWLEGDGLLSAMADLRADLMAGDLRACYLVWLLGIDLGFHEPDDLEPPLPDGLGDLGHAHEALIDFFGLDRDLVVAAAQDSPFRRPASEIDLAEQLALLPQAEKDDFLLRLARGEAGLQAILQRRLKALAPAPAPSTRSAPQRKVRDLQALAASICSTREAAEKAAQEKARQLRLAQISRDKDVLWREVHFYIQRRKGDDYARAVQVLLDLQAAADQARERVEFDRLLEQLVREVGRLSSLMAKMKAAGLV